MKNASPRRILRIYLGRKTVELVFRIGNAATTRQKCHGLDIIIRNKYNIMYGKKNGGTKWHRNAFLSTCIMDFSTMSFGKSNYIPSPRGIRAHKPLMGFSWNLVYVPLAFLIMKTYSFSSPETRMKNTYKKKKKKPPLHGGVS